MAHVTLNSPQILGCLISLLNKLAQAITWISRQQGKVTIEVPDDLFPKIRNREDIECYVSTILEERANAEILLGILKLMGKKPGRQSKTRPSK